MRSYAIIIGSAVFAIIALLHLLRLFFPTRIEIGTVEIPQWVSLFIFLIAGTLSGWILRVPEKTEN